jgi:hypothetical protein
MWQLSHMVSIKARRDWKQLRIRFRSPGVNFINDFLFEVEIGPNCFFLCFRRDQAQDFLAQDPVLTAHFVGTDEPLFEHALHRAFGNLE